MNVGMTGRARYAVRRPLPLPVNGAGRNRTVALVAQRGDSGHVQEARILRTVRRVTGRAALALHRSMLVNERAAHIGVALGANRTLIGSGLQVVWTEGAVSVMAVGALDQALIHLVMNGHVELGFLLGVAAIAKRRLRCFQHVVLLIVCMSIRVRSEQVQRGLERLGRVGAMNRVAAYAADPSLGMRRAQEVRVRSRVALQAGRIDFLRRSFSRVEDLCYIAAAIHMGLARAVAVLAGDPGAAVHFGHLGVGVIGEFLAYLFVAGRAGFAAHKIRWNGGFALGLDCLRFRRW